MLKAFDAAPVSKTDKALQKLLRAREADWPIGIGPMPKVGKFRRMLRECGSSGDRRLIYIGNRRPKGARRPRIHPTAEEGLAAIPILGRTTVWRLLTRHSDYDMTRMRLGARMAQRAFKPLKGKLEARRILDVAVMDHTVLDCFVIDDEHHIPVGRPQAEGPYRSNVIRWQSTVSTRRHRQCCCCRRSMN